MVAVWQYVKQEAPDELLDAGGHLFLPVIVTVVLPVEVYYLAVEAPDPVIGYSNTVGITECITLCSWRSYRSTSLMYE